MFQDVSFLYLRKRSYHSKSAEYSEETKTLHRSQNTADYRIYDYLLQRHLETRQQEVNLKQEVEALTAINSQIEMFCQTALKVILQSWNKTSYDFDSSLSNNLSVSVSAMPWQEMFTVDMV